LPQTQGSLVDFVVDDCGSMGDGDNEFEMSGSDEMANVYLTSLLPMSQQPEGFGFGPPKYSTTGFKLRKREMEVQPALPAAKSRSHPSLGIPPTTVFSVFSEVAAKYTLRVSNATTAEMQQALTTAPIMSSMQYMSSSPTPLIPPPKMKHRMCLQRKLKATSSTL
jgi:hypothetical protein